MITEVPDFIHIRYDVSIDSYKHQEDNTYIVSMKKVSYKYLESEYTPVLVPQIFLIYIKLRWYIMIRYQNIR